MKSIDTRQSWKSAGTHTVRSLIALGACVAVLLATSQALALTPIAQFRENVQDPNTGLYMWSEVSNWTWANTSTESGLPHLPGQVEVGDDNSGPVSVYMDVPWADCYGVEIAEGANTAGSSIRIPVGATLECHSRC